MYLETKTNLTKLHVECRVHSHSKEPFLPVAMEQYMETSWLSIIIMNHLKLVTRLED
jgi:hypothetical protein